MRTEDGGLGVEDCEFKGCERRKKISTYALHIQTAIVSTAPME